MVVVSSVILAVLVVDLVLLGKGVFLVVVVSESGRGGE